MKAILIAFLLFASVFFLPTSTLARELKEETFQTGDPNNPAVKCSPGEGYRNCSPSSTPPAPPTLSAPPCSDYTRNC
ncbi:hypothetical protein DEO72_LG10g2319 [Vigna unguiculata]|uniref:Rapid ALkalinization Factor n=1 Tax=Vigna unguiculata TaxID=3917 RepID=A0A4D6NBL3_VIGUN|nr:hypothetical protein DEO72_LG10g2319 [Vigna unguiculata]